MQKGIYIYTLEDRRIHSLFRCSLCRHSCFSLQGSLFYSVLDILGDTAVSVNVAGGEVRVPYALLLTKLNTLITLTLEGTPTDFHLWVEPSSPETFR